MGHRRKVRNNSHKRAEDRVTVIAARKGIDLRKADDRTGSRLAMAIVVPKGTGLVMVNAAPIHDRKAVRLAVRKSRSLAATGSAVKPQRLWHDALSL